MALPPSTCAGSTRAQRMTVTWIVARREPDRLSRERQDARGRAVRTVGGGARFGRLAGDRPLDRGGPAARVEVLQRELRGRQPATDRLDERRVLAELAARR